MSDGVFRFRSDAPWRHQFDNARDPYTARNALGIPEGGGGGAPTDAQYIVAADDPTLTNDRVLTDTATITWDFTTPGQVMANAAIGGGGNVSNTGTPTAGQYAQWTAATVIQGVAPTTVLTDIGAQPLDADLTAIAALTGTNTIYYRSAANTWSAVNVSTGLSFSGGNLTATGGGGNVSNVGTPTNGQLAQWTTATTIQGVSLATAGIQPLDATLTALAAYNTNGLLTQTAADTFTGRTLIGPAAGLTVSNGNGVAGNPTLALANDLAALEALTGTNTVYYRSATDTWAAVTIGGNLSFSGGTLNTAITPAPVSAEYITSTADATLTAERVLTDTASITWDRSTPGQIKANSAAGGGNVSNSGTPAVGQYGRWVTATTIEGVAPATVLTDIGAAPIASPTFTGDPKAPTASPGDNDTTLATTAFVTAAVAAAGGGAATPGPPQGRLTLQTATPVMITTQSAKTTIYYTPYIGNQVPLYNGTAFTMTAFAEISVATTDTTKSPAAIGASKVNDWFVWSDSGTVRIGHGPDWTSDTARSAGTALTRVNGIWLNNAAITNGPAASRGTYVGTTRSNASSQLDWIFGAAGTAGLLGVWNCYNRIPVHSMTSDANTGWTYAGTAWRPMRNSTLNSVAAVFGLDEDPVEINVEAYISAPAGAQGHTGVGLDSITANPVGLFGASSNGIENIISSKHVSNQLGRHIWYAMEVTAGASVAFNGTAAASYRSGIILKARM